MLYSPEYGKVRLLGREKSPVKPEGHRPIGRHEEKAVIWLARDDMPENLFTQREVLIQFCETHRIRRLSLFGSMARGNAGPESDIDLLIEFERGAEPGLIGLANLEIEFSHLLAGRRVDLRTPGDLSPYFRDEVLRDAIPQYAA
jgi:hypothetical protein